MMKTLALGRVLDYLFYLIFFGFWVYIFGHFLMLMTPIGGGSAIISWAVMILLVGLFLLFFNINSVLKELFVGIIFTIFFLIGIVFATAAPYFTFFMVFVASCGFYGIFHLNRAIWAIRVIRKKPSSEQKSTVNQKPRAIITFMLIIGVVLLGIPFIAPKTETYSVSQEQAEKAEIVLYWHTINYEALDNSIVDICRDTNTVLSLNLMEYNFIDGDPRGEKCAQIIAYANSQGVKIEVYPIFEKERGWYPSYNETSILRDLYNKFSDWTGKHGIFVDYFLFDIETALENPPYSGWASAIPLFADIGQMGMEINNMHVRRENWAEVLQEWKAVLSEIKADGLIPRATMPPYYYDLLDGDSDVQIKGGTPALDIVEEFEYISMMIYRGCEWGNNDPQEYVGRAVETMKTYLPGPIAVCLGCLNYNTYQTESAIVQDIHLAIAKGASSVRIFEGSAWIIGHDDVKGHSLDSLKEILVRAREAGSGEYQTSGVFQSIFAGAVLLDILLNTM